MVHLALSACAAACATACVLPRLPACAILSTLLACLGVLAYIEPHADRRRRQRAAVVARLLFAAAEETEHALVVSAAELHRAQHASREHARELQVARRAAKSLVELERRQVALVAAAERDGFHASGWATRTVESEESACWASRAMEASSDGTHLETEVRLAIAAARRAAMFERDAAVEALGEARHAAQEVGRTPRPPHLCKLLPLSCGAQPQAWPRWRRLSRTGAARGGGGGGGGGGHGRGARGGAPPTA